MKEIIKGKIYLGSKIDYFNMENIITQDDWVFVHIGSELFDKFKKNDSKDYYIIDNHLYLSWEDLPENGNFNIDTIIKIFDFIDSFRDKMLYIHCDYGQSRSPAVLMAYLSKRTDYLPKANYKAVVQFNQIYPDYFSQGGISLFIKREWDNII